MDKIKCLDLFEKSNISYIDELIFSKENPWEVLPEIKSHIKWDFINGNYKYKSILDNNAFVYAEIAGLNNYILLTFFNEENNDIEDNLKRLVDLKNKTLKYKDNICEETIVFNGNNDSITISHFEQNQKMWQLTLTKTENITHDVYTGRKKVIMVK